MSWNEPRRFCSAISMTVFVPPRRYTDPFSRSTRLRRRMTRSKVLKRLASPGLQEPRAAHHAGRHGKHERGVAQGPGELGLAPRPQQPPHRQQGDLVVLPVVEEALHLRERRLGVDRVDGDAEHLDPFHPSRLGFHVCLSRTYRADRGQGVQRGRLGAQHPVAEPRPAEPRRLEQRRLPGREAAFGSDQHGDGAVGSGEDLVQRFGTGAILVEEDGRAVACVGPPPRRAARRARSRSRGRRRSARAPRARCAPSARRARSPRRPGGPRDRSGAARSGPRRPRRPVG